MHASKKMPPSQRDSSTSKLECRGDGGNQVLSAERSFRLREEMAEQEKEVVEMERAAATEQRRNRQPTATEKEKEEQRERETT